MIYRRLFISDYPSTIIHQRLFISDYSSVITDQRLFINDYLSATSHRLVATEIDKRLRAGGGRGSEEVKLDLRVNSRP